MTRQGPIPGNPPAGVHGVLSVLEEMAAEAGSGGVSLGVPRHFEWLPVSAARRLAGEPLRGWPEVDIDADIAKAFAVVDEIRPQHHSLRVGLGFVAGQTDDDDEPRRLFEPLLVLPVQVEGRRLRRVGDVELTPLVEDRHLRLLVEQDNPWASHGFPADAVDLSGAHLAPTHPIVAHSRRIARVAGFPSTHVMGATYRPSTLRDAPGISVVIGVGLFAVDTHPRFSPAAGLARWQQAVGTTWTALHSVYLDHPAPAAEPAGPDLPSAYPLTADQHAAVIDSRSRPVTVIAGAPGTGKTHTIAAIVGDAVARGRSVLVAARSEAAVEAITELLERRPGPDPVVFGSTTRRIHLARRLAAGEPDAVPHAHVEALAAAMRSACEERDARWRMAADQLRGLALLGQGAQADRMRRRLPGLATADVVELQRLLSVCEGGPGRWWQRDRRQAWRRLNRLVGVDGELTGHDVAVVQTFVAAVVALHDRADRLGDGVDWQGLARAQHTVEGATGEWMDALARDERRLDRHARSVLGALAGALRASRSSRRTRLATLAGQHMTSALPLWIGTLADIDDLLPFQPALFDLVVLDEASSIDQPRAASALLRGARAVVVGDPQQLRHVSFVATDANTAAIDAHLPASSPLLRAKLDVRGNSIFDVAASGSSVLTLAEHFRSTPHLFAFVGRRLYRDEVALANRTPVTDRQDRIAAVRLSGTRNKQKVVVAEVEWVIERVQAMRERGHRSVGVVSPFRAQADALEDAALMRLGRDAIRDLGLRVGTVHAFQGMERDVMIVSVGIGPEEGSRTWQFANDPNLFAVLATRARHWVEVVHSADPPPGSLLADYLDQVDHPPAPPDGVAAGVDPWTAVLAGDLADAGCSVVAPYWAGHHPVDLCVHRGERFLGVETRLHPSGPDAHIRRHLELVALGWPLVSALPQLWRGERAGVAVALSTRLDDLGR